MEPQRTQVIYFSSDQSCGEPSSLPKLKAGSGKALGNTHRTCQSPQWSDYLINLKGLRYLPQGHPDVKYPTLSPTPTPEQTTVSSEVASLPGPRTAEIPLKPCHPAEALGWGRGPDKLPCLSTLLFPGSTVLQHSATEAVCPDSQSFLSAPAFFVVLFCFLKGGKAKGI